MLKHLLRLRPHRARRRRGDPRAAEALAAALAVAMLALAAALAVAMQALAAALAVAKLVAMGPAGRLALKGASGGLMAHPHPITLQAPIARGVVPFAALVALVRLRRIHGGAPGNLQHARLYTICNVTISKNK